MDYTEEFFRKLRPANDQQQHFIYWVMMTEANRPGTRYGRLPSYGTSPIHDVFYNSLYTSMQAMRVCEMSDVMDEAMRKRLEEMALLANGATEGF